MSKEIAPIHEKLFGNNKEVTEKVSIENLKKNINIDPYKKPDILDKKTENGKDESEPRIFTVPKKILNEIVFENCNLRDLIRSLPKGENTKNRFFSGEPIILINDAREKSPQKIDAVVLTFEDKGIGKYVFKGEMDINEEEIDNPLDHVRLDYSTTIGYLSDFKEPTIIKNEVGEPPITRRSMSKVLKRLAAAGLVGATAAALTTVVYAADNGGTWANVDMGSVTKLGEITYAEPLVKRPDSGATIVKTSVQVEVKKPIYYNLIKETTISAKVLEVLDKRTDKATSVARSIQFMAGGEYLTSTDAQPLALKAKITRLNETTKKNETIEATVVFADKDRSEAYKKLSPMEKVSCSSDSLCQSLINKIPSFSKIRKELTNKSFLYVLNGETYVFTDQNLKPGNKIVTKYDTKGNKSTITKEVKLGSPYYSRIAFYEGFGINIYDGTKITEKLNTQTKKFEELATPEFVGTLKQRTVYALETAYKLKNDVVFMCPTSNPLDISLKDIEEFKKNGLKGKYKSFEVVVVNPQEKDEKKQLGFICLIGGKCGLQKESNLKSLKLAIEKCNKIDPKITQKWVERGLNFLAIDEVSKTVFSGTRENWFGTFYNYLCGGTIFTHEDSVDYSLNPYRWFSHLEEESIGLSGFAKGFNMVYIETWKEDEFEKNANNYLYPGWEENGLDQIIK